MAVFLDREIKLLGLSLYKCEGTKRRKVKGRKSDYCYAIEFTNSDPKIIEYFLLFLRQVLKVAEEKIKVELFVYEDLNLADIKEFWKDITKIPEEQLEKIIVLRQRNSKYKPNPRGTCKIRYYSKEKFLELESMIQEVFS